MYIYHMLWPLHSSIRARAPINHGLPPGPFQVLPRPRKLQTCGVSVLFSHARFFFLHRNSPSGGRVQRWRRDASNASKMRRDGGGGGGGEDRVLLPRLDRKEARSF